MRGLFITCFSLSLLSVVLLGTACRRTDGEPSQQTGNIADGQQQSQPDRDVVETPENASPTTQALTPSDKFTHMIVMQSEYYLTGPQQARPPDGQFAPDTPVNIVEDGGSYLLVRTADGIEAWVARDAVKLAEDHDAEESQTRPTRP